MGGGLKNDPDFGTNGSRVNPEISQNPRMNGTAAEGNSIIAVSMEDAIKQKKLLNTSLEEGIAFNIAHGAGHNSGLNHNGDKIDPGDSKSTAKIPFASVMNDGRGMSKNCNQGPKPQVPELAKVRDFMTSKDNQVLIPTFHKKFGSGDPIVTQTFL